MLTSATLATADSRLDMAHAALDAIQRTQAVVEFDMQGHVLHANQNFLDAMGYTLGEIVGRHHRMFCGAARHPAARAAAAIRARGAARRRSLPADLVPHAGARQPPLPRPRLKACSDVDCSRCHITTRPRASAQSYRVQLNI